MDRHADASARGLILSFLPAHSDSRAGAVAQQLTRTFSEGLGLTVLLADFDRRAYSVWSANQAPRRLDDRTWGAFVSEVDGIQVLNAREVDPRQLGQLLEYMRNHFDIVCADLTAAQDAHANPVLQASDGIFLVTGSDQASLESAREKIDALETLDLARGCGLLLERTPHGLNSFQAEELTGVPVSSLVENARQISVLANWIAANTGTRKSADSSKYALAV